MNENNKLCLEGDLAKPFMDRKVGDTVPITIDAVVTSVGVPPVNGEPVNGEPQQQGDYIEFALQSVNGKGEGAGEDMDQGPDYKNMESAEFEKHVAKNRGY